MFNNRYRIIIYAVRFLKYLLTPWNLRGQGIFGGLAQLVEHLPCKQGVSGSIPLTSTNTAQSGTNGFIAQLVRAHA